jgi:ornithine cyclodeaminase
MEKTHVAWGDGHTLHAVGAALVGRGVVGTKTWAHTAGGATPLMLLWDAESGALRAIIEAFVLGQLRTAAVSAVATKWLASGDASEMAIIGSGKQALPQVAAAVAVRPIDRVRIFSPNQEHARALAARIEEAGLGPATEVCGDVKDAVADTAIVTTATRARDPFLHGAMLAAGTHVNAIGAITPERRELAADVLGRCTAVVADSPDAARRLSSEVEGAPTITALSAVVALGKSRRPDADVTLFKAMGIGLADVALGVEILERADAEGAGRDMPQPEKAQPRLRS